MGEFVNWIEGHIKEGEEHVDRSMENLNAALIAGVKGAAPIGATSNLRHSIAGVKTGYGWSATVLFGAGAKYAPYVEYGTRAHFPPVEALVRYAGGIKEAWAMAVGISKKGTKPHPYFWGTAGRIIAAWRWTL